MHRVSGLVGPAECSPSTVHCLPLYLSLIPSVLPSFLLSHRAHSLSLLPLSSFVPCLCPVSLSLSLFSLPVQIVYNSGFAIRLLCRSRATGFSLYFEHYVYKRVYVQNRTCIYIYMYIYESCTRMYICFSFFARLYNDTDCVPVSTGLACRRVYPCTKYSSDTVH